MEVRQRASSERNDARNSTSCHYLPLKSSHELLTILTHARLNPLTSESNYTNMILQSPASSTTPSHVSAVSPVQWLRAFAYTPDSARVRKGSQRPESGVEHRMSLRDEDSDALPTRFDSCGVVGGARGAVRDSSEASVSDACFMVPRKRKRQSGGREALSSASISDGLSATHGLSSQLRTGKTRCASPSRGSGRGEIHAPAPSRAGSRRVVLDAVEIVSKKGSRARMADPTTVRGGARKTVSSHYPSPPVTRAPRDVAVHDSHSSAPVPHPNTEAGKERADPEPTLPFKTSKYFARLSPPLTGSVSERPPVLTPPSSPMLTIPVYLESSDFEYPPLDDSFVEPAEGIVDQSRRVPTRYDSPGLFDDLMIMLRRLKPILVQGGWFRPYYYLSHERANSLPKQRVYETTRGRCSSLSDCST